MKVRLDSEIVLVDITSLCSQTVMVGVTSMAVINIISNEGLESDADDIPKPPWRLVFHVPRG